MITNKLTNKQVLNDVIDANNDYIYKNTIEILNNEDFVLDLSGIKMLCSDSSVSDSELLKIKINWGDGEEEIVKKRLNAATSSIGVYVEQDWLQITHRFNTDKRNVYLTDDVRALPKIAITLYNSFNDTVTVYIPYKLVYKSIYDLGTKFTLKSGNISNSNRSSFVLKNQKDNGLVVIAVKDWQKIYGDDEVVYIEDNFVSKDYADEFVNEENIIWDWNDVPKIVLSVETKTEGGKVYLDCSFQEKNVNLDSWTPRCFKITDTQIQLTDIEKNPNGDNQFIVRDARGLSDGIYKVYIEMVGINDVQGTSEIMYKKNATTFCPDKLLKPSVGFEGKNDDQRYITFRYSLPNNAYPSHIKYAYLYLTTNEYDTSNNGVSNVFTKEVDNITFKYNLSFNPEDKFVTKSGEEYYETRIPYNEIPNGKYKIAIQVKELSKTSADAPEINIYGDATKQNGIYEPKMLQLKYTNIGTISTPNLVLDDVNQIRFDWTVTNPSEMIDTMYRISKYKDVTDGSKKIESYITDKKQNYTNYNYTKISNGYKFTQTLSPKQFQDGNYKIEVGHILPMTKYVGQRQKLSEKQFTYIYPSPDMRISSICPYFRNVKGSIVPYVRFHIQKPQNDQVGGVELLYGETIPDKCSVAKVLNQVNVDVELNKLLKSGGANGGIPYFAVAAKAFNVLDSTYKRKSRNPFSYRITQTKPLPDKVINTVYKNDNIVLSQSFIENRTKKEVTGMELSEGSFYNVLKNYKWQSKKDNRTFYSYDVDVNYFDAVSVKNQNEKVNLRMMFEGKIYTSMTTGQKILRYVPCTESLPELEQPVKLQTVKDFLGERVITVNKIYDKIINRFSLAISSKVLPYEDYTCEINDAQVYLYKLVNGDYELYAETSLRKSFYNVIPQVEAGQYKMLIDFHSIYTDNDENSVYTCSWTDSDSPDMVIRNLNVKVEANDTITHNYSIVNSTIDENSRYVNVTWTVNETTMKNLKLKYEVDTYSSGELTNTEAGEKVIGFSKEGLYEIPYELTTGVHKVRYWFTFDSDNVNWGTNKTVPDKIYTITV